MWSFIVSAPNHLVSGTGCGVLLYRLLIIWYVRECGLLLYRLLIIWCVGQDMELYCIGFSTFDVWDRMWSSIVSTPDHFVSGTGCGIVLYRLVMIWCLGQEVEFYCIDS